MKITQNYLTLKFYLTRFISEETEDVIYYLAGAALRYFYVSERKYSELNNYFR